MWLNDYRITAILSDVRGVLASCNQAMRIRDAPVGRIVLRAGYGE
jgi:hypothetical protein